VRASQIISLVVWTTPAWAQIPDATEGRGIKVGDGLVLHPGLMVDTAYDSNLHYAAGTDAPDEHIVGSPYLRFTGHLDLASLPAQRLGGSQPKLDLRVNGAVSYREYLKDDKAVKKLRALDLEGGFRATFNPQGLVHFRIFDQFARLRQPRNSEGPFNITRDRNRAGAELGARPGGGTVSAAVGYEFDVEFYEEDLQSDPVGDPGNPDSLWHIVTGAGKWKFLPKTAATLDVAYSIYDKDNGVLIMSGEPAYQDSTALRTYAGVVGLLTPRVTATFKAGYGRADYDADEDFGGVIGKADVEWRATPQTRLNLGYERSFQDSVAANFYMDDQFHAGFEQRIASRWQLTLEPAIRFRRYESYREQFDPGGMESARDDTLGELHAGLAFYTFPWFLVGGAYNLEVNASGWRGGEGEYSKHVVLLRLEAAF